MKGSMKEQIERKIKKGIGFGILEKYQPWIKTYSISSKGRVTRMKGWKTGRLHHLLSDLERNYFLLLDWNDDVVDIREQYPLLPIDVTINIAETIGVKHTTDPKTKEINVMTTDFLITIKRDNKVFDIARTLKYVCDLNSYRTIEKFEVERRFWASKGIDWGIVTEKEVNTTMADNIRELHQNYWLNTDPSFSQKNVDTFYEWFCEIKNYNSELCIAIFLKEFDMKMGFMGGMGIQILKYLISHKKIKTDLNRKISYRKDKLEDYFIIC